MGKISNSIKKIPTTFLGFYTCRGLLNIIYSLSEYKFMDQSYRDDDCQGYVNKNQ